MRIGINALVILIGLATLFKIINFKEPNFKDEEDFEIYEHNFWNKKNKIYLKMKNLIVKENRRELITIVIFITLLVGLLVSELKK